MLERELVQVLNDEIGILEVLLSKEKEKKEVILSRDYTKLKKVDEEESVLFSRLQKFECERVDIVKKLANKFLLDGEVTLSRIIPFSNNQSTLIELRNKLISLVEEIRLVCLENRVIIESSISVSLAVLEKITDTNHSEVKYNSEGKKVFGEVDFTTYTTIT